MPVLRVLTSDWLMRDFDSLGPARIAVSIPIHSLSISGSMMSRSETNHCILGQPTKLPDNVLPTVRQTLQHLKYLKQRRPPKEPIQNLAFETAQCVQEMWNKCNIPAATGTHSLGTRISKLYNKAMDINKYNKSRKNYDTMVRSLNEEFDALFDVCTCKCDSFIKCSCPIKVPVNEREFLLDQRTARQMYVSTVDVPGTRKLQRKFYREALESSIASSSSTSISSPRHLRPTSIEERAQVSNEETGPIVKPPNFFPSCAVMADRYGVSNTAAAAICSATLKDANIDKVVDRSKIMRDRKTMRLSSQASADMQSLTALYFDGKRTDTLFHEQNSRKSVKQEHIVLVGQPDNKYIGHITPETGSAQAVVDCIMDFFETKGIDPKQMRIGK